MLSCQQVYRSNSIHTLSVLMQMSYTSELPNSVSRIVRNMELVMSECKNIDRVK